MIKYARDRIISDLQKGIEMPSLLYQLPCCKRRGKTQDGEWYSELAAEFLSDHFESLTRGLKPINRPEYDTPSHRRPRRLEEHVAKCLYQTDLGPLGRVVDYQVPLKKSRANKAVGKIDLISFRSAPDPCVYLIELKCGENPEPLLRAALEIYTYSNQLHKANLLASYKEFGRLGEHDIKTAILVTQGTGAHEDARSMQSMPELRKFIQLLQIEVFELQPWKSERITI